MRLERIDIDAFGALCHARLDDLEPRLSVIYGPNGAGKSTLLHFLRGVFCGYENSRQLGLLPTRTGEPGGGAVDVGWRGERYRLRRTATTNGDGTLSVSVLRDDGEARQSRLEPDTLPVDHISLLYTVAHGDIHALDRLVESARRAGIEVDSTEQERSRLMVAATDSESQPTRSPDSSHGRIAELTSRLSRLHIDLEQLTARFDERCREVSDEHRIRIESELSRAWQRVNWLDAELQAAETDLSEAERSAGRRSRPTHFDFERIAPTIPTVRPRRVPSTKHLAVNHRQELADIEDAIGTARTRLTEIAQARLEVDLQAARIAGSLDLPADEFLVKLRASLSHMEDSLLELRDDTEWLRPRRQPHQGASDTGSAASQSAVDALRHKLYSACESVSQFELKHRKSKLQEESNRLDRDAHAVHEELEALQVRRQELTERTGQLTIWRGSAQRAIEQRLCGCAEHDHHEIKPPVPLTTGAARIVGDLRRDFAGPNDKRDEELLARLRLRRSDLRAELDAARGQLRASRVQRRQERAWPADVRDLEQQIDQKRQELNGVERELSELRSQSVALAVGGDVPGGAERADRSAQPKLMRWAAAYLARLTERRYVNLRLSADGSELLIVDDAGREHTSRMLSRGTLDRVALSLRMAIVRALAEKNIRFPLVLDDVLVDCDLERLQDGVQLLTEFAAEHDQQILYLTCGTHLVSLFASAGAAVRTMPGVNTGAPVPQRIDKPRVQRSVSGWIDRPPREAAIRTPAVDERGDSPSPPFVRRQPGEPYWLSAESELVLVPSIGEQMGRRLSALGIRTAADLLNLAGTESSIPLRSLQIEPNTLREWQAEALLLTCVPDLAGPDAQLLVACGVQSPHQLAASDVDELISRLERYARRHPHSALGGARPSRACIGRWIQCGRRARPRTAIERHARQERRVGRVELGPRTTASETLQPPHTELQGRATDPHRPSSPINPSMTHVSEREEILKSDEGAVTRLSIAAQRPPETHSFERTFYLHAASPVEDGPSIGPKMASHLKRLKIITVGDLLAAAPAIIAARLKLRRVKEETITAWQQQARLMCRIPELRGHDAQVLVACEITEPEQVAGLDARTLFSIVGPFVATKEGQRLLRSSKTPDLEEVADWIEWAKQARPLRAA